MYVWSKVWGENETFSKIGHLKKIQIFCPIFIKIGTKVLPHKLIIFTKFHKKWSQNVDFFSNGPDFSPDFIFQMNDKMTFCFSMTYGSRIEVRATK